MRTFIFCLSLVAGPALAQDRVCDDLWFTRNLVFHKAGYCFGSPLGEAVFGNASCSTKSPNLTAREKALVDRVKSYEAEWSCKTDTSRTALDGVNVPLRMSLGDQPVMTGYESACIGWQGAPRPLYIAKSQGAAVVGQLLPGQTILTAYENADGWEFATIQDGNQTVLQGWLPLDPADWTCAQYAG